MKNKLICFVFVGLFLISFVSATLNVALSHQASDLRYTNGTLVKSANLTIFVYGGMVGGSLIYNETFVGAIKDGSWNVMIGENPLRPLNLEYGKIYYQDIEVDGSNFNFTNSSGDEVPRKLFYSPLGDVGGEDLNLTNLTLNSLNVTGITNLGNVTIDADNITINNILPKDNGFVKVWGDLISSKGFFNFLGSLTSRITGFFVQDIDFNGTLSSGKINITGSTGNVETSGSINASNYILNGTTISDWNEAGIDTRVAGDNNYLTNDSTIMYFNETKLNITIDARSDFDTQKGTSGKYVYNDSINIMFNETQLNKTIESLDNDTTYTHLTNFTDDLGNRGYTHLTNFTDDILWTTAFNNTFDSRDKNTWNTSAEMWLAIDNGTFLKTFTEADPYWQGNLTAHNASWNYYEVDTDTWNTSAEMWLAIDNGTFSKATHLSNFTDDLGNRGYTSLSNFTNDKDYINSTQAEIYNDSLRIDSLNSSKLNVDDQRYNETDLINAVNTTANVKSLGFNTTTELDTKYISQSNETNLNVNSSNWWNGVSNWISGWFVNNAGTLEFNETKLNESIDARTAGLDTDTHVAGDNNYLINDSTTMYFNETKLNDTIDARAIGSEADPYWQANLTAHNASWSLDTDTWNTSAEMWNAIDNGTFLKSFTEADPYWQANLTAHNASWSLDTDTWNTSAEMWLAIDNGTFSKATHLSNLTDDILWTVAFNSTFDARDSDTTYSHLSNFTDDILWTAEFNATGDSRWFGIEIWNESGVNIYPRNLSQNVGIGTNTPSVKLDVLGFIKSDNFYTNATSHRTYVGENVGTGLDGDYVTAIGEYASHQNTQNYVTSLGYQAGRSNTGSSQTAIGSGAGYQNSGSSQTALGYNAGRVNSGSSQTAIGSSAGSQNTGVSQTAVGYYAGYLNTGNRVIGIGYESTRNNTADNVVAMGYQAGKDNAISNQFIVKQTNVNAIPLIQGDFSSGNVGIGTSTPSAKLSILSLEGSKAFAVRNATGSVDAFSINENGSFMAMANDGGRLLWSPGGAGALYKSGGDEFWYLGEESVFSGIVDTGYIDIAPTIARAFNVGSNFSVYSNGTFMAMANDGGKLLWNPAGSGTLKKSGGDEFWRLSEESMFTGIVDTDYIYVEGPIGWGGSSFVVRNTHLSESNKDDLVEFRSQSGSSRHRFSAANSSSDVDYAKYILGDPAGYRIEMDARIGEVKVLGGDNWWSLGEETFFRSYLGEMGNTKIVAWWRADKDQFGVNHTLLLTPTDSPNVCNAGIKGSLYYDNSSDELYDCDGTSWQPVNSGGVEIWNESGANIYPRNLSQNVGIGTATPQYELDVDGNIGFTSYIYHRGDDNTHIQVYDDNLRLRAGGERMVSLHEDGTQDYLELGDGGDVNVFVNVGGVNNALFVDGDDGNLGVGTSIPSQRFHVVGNSNFTGNITPGMNDTYSLGSPSAWFKELYVGSNSIYVGGIKLHSDNGNLVWDGNDLITNATNYWTNSSGNVTYTSGKVGIGTISPDTSLHLNGTLTLEDSYGKTGKIEYNSYGVGNGWVDVTAAGTNDVIFRVSDLYNTIFNVGTSNHASSFRDNLDVGGNVTATSFIGDGSQLTGIGSGMWTNSSGNATFISGNVGIGTTSPNSLLTIKGSSNTDLSLIAGQSANAELNFWADEGDDSQDKWKIEADGAGLHFEDVYGSKYFSLGYNTAVVVNEGGDDDVNFRVESDTNTHAFFVNATNGNVGIGTSTPSVALDVEVSSGGAATIGSSGNTATGDYAVAMGHNTVASRDYSTAIGGGTTASEDYAFATGYNTLVSGRYSSAFGSRTTASGRYAIVMGYNNNVSGNYAFTGGRHMQPTSGDGTFVWGHSSSAQSFAPASNRFLIFPQGDVGRVGIGTSTPSAELEVNGSLQATDYYSEDGSQGITNTTGYWLCNNSACSTTCQVQIKDGLIVGCT